MAEQRRKIGSVLLRIEGKTGSDEQRFELFPAEQWPDQGGRPGHFRVRRNGVWQNADGRRHTFYNVDGLLALLAAALRQVPGARRARRPAIERGMWISVANGHVVDGKPMSDRTRVSNGPFQGHDGRWRVYVVGRNEPVPIEECKRWGW